MKYAEFGMPLRARGRFSSEAAEAPPGYLTDSSRGGAWSLSGEPEGAQETCLRATPQNCPQWRSPSTRARAHKRHAHGSRNSTSSGGRKFDYANRVRSPAEIAQLVEHRSEKPGVGSSILPLGTFEKAPSLQGSGGVFDFQRGVALRRGDPIRDPSHAGVVSRTARRDGPRPAEIPAALVRKDKPLDRASPTLALPM